MQSWFKEKYWRAAEHANVVTTQENPRLYLNLKLKIVAVV